MDIYMRFYIVYTGYYTRFDTVYTGYYTRHREFLLSLKYDPIYVLVILHTGCHQALQAVLVRMRQCVIVIAMCGWHKGSSVRVIDVKDALYERVELP